MSRLSLVLCAMCCCLSLSLQLGVEATTIYVHNQCNVTVCTKYWGTINGVGGGCSEQGGGGTWTVNASSSWVGSTMWAVTNTGCAGQACNMEPPVGFTQFEILVAGFGGNDYYDITTLQGFNIAMKVVPTNGGCPVVDCGGANATDCPEGFYPGGPVKTKTCSTGTDYNLYLCA